MATNARKDLAKALRTAFGVESSNNSNSKEFNGNSTSTSSSMFEDYEPPASLLEALDEWANSSSIQNGTTERDIAKLRETLADHCFEQGMNAGDSRHHDNDRIIQAKSAFIVILDRFSSLESEVVTVDEIREVWWNRLLLPALTLSDTPASETIRIGRGALKAARNMAVRALNASSGFHESALSGSGSDKDKERDKEKEAAQKWTKSVFKAYIAAQQDSFAQRNLQQILVAYGKAHPKDFFIAISDLLDTPVETLCLLNNYIRIHPVQAYQAFQTPLFSNIVTMLDELPIPTESGISLNTEDSGNQLLWVGSALCTLTMLMPRLPTSLDKLLDRFFIILARCLLWYDSISSAWSPTAYNDVNATADNNKSPDLSASLVAPALQITPLHALLDFFTHLYGLFPVNLIAFLSSPVKWLQSYYKRMHKRRNRVASTINLSSMGRDALLHPFASSSSGNNYTSSSTSADEGASGTDLPMSGVEEGDEGTAAALRKRRTSKSAGGRKGQRSKINKAKRDVAARAKKEKETAKQKERERRRRSANLLEASAGAPGAVTDQGAQSDVPFPSASENRDAEGQSNPEPNETEDEDGLAKASTSSKARALKVRIEEPDTPTVADHRSHAEAEHSSDGQDSTLSEDESARDIEGELEGMDLDTENANLDWDRLKVISKPYIVQHVLSSSLLTTTEGEFSHNKNRFKKLEAPDLIDEITRTRIAPSSGSGLSSSISHDQGFSPSMASPPTSALTGSMSALGLSVDTLANDRQVLMMQNQLIFETYQKNQLAQRLGSLLRDRIATSGAEADKQNLMHQIRSLKSQLSHSQEKLEQLRHESALSRERLNKYASDQSGRVEKLRADRQTLNSENISLKSELDDLKASLAALSEELAESKKECFELKSEQDYAATQQQEQLQQETVSDQ